MRPSQGFTREGGDTNPDRRARPRLEGLEERLLLYATLGANWVYGARITYSFVPDGTSVGGVPSSLYQSLSPLGAANWQREIHRAMDVWQAVANVNLVQVPDDGSPIGVYGNQQSDGRFGDIRISAIPLAYGTMGAAYSPPPLNGGTIAGDIVFNSTMSWKINAHYDLRTVAIHEIGHALGMGHSSISQAVMYSYYTSIKQSLNADDTAGVRTIYDARQYDFWNSDGRSNQMYWDAVTLDNALSPLNQITVANVNITTYSQTQWYWVTVPATNIGQFSVTLQSSNLSLLSPQLVVTDSNLQNAKYNEGTAYGDTTTIHVTNVSAYQGFFIRIASAGGGRTGSFALQINFGTTPMAPVAPPYTMVPYQPSQGGGLNTLTTTDDDHDHTYHPVKIGTLGGWGDSLHAAGVARFSPIREQLLAAAILKTPDVASRSISVLAAAEASVFGSGWANVQTTSSLGWGHADSRQSSAFDAALIQWGVDDGFGKSSPAKRRIAAV